MLSRHKIANTKLIQAYPEIEAQGFSQSRYGRSNPYLKGTDCHIVWEFGARQYARFIEMA